MNSYDPLNEKQLEESIQYYFARMPRCGRIIYLAVLMILTLALASLLLIRVRISITAHGILRPATEKTSIHSLTAGTVDRLMVREGQAISYGDTLLLLKNDHLIQQLERSRQRLVDLIRKKRDARNILDGKTHQLGTSEMTASWNRYSTRHRELSVQQVKAVREKTRIERLYVDSLVSEKEYDDLLHQERLLQEKVRVLAGNYRSELEHMLVELDSEQKQLENHICTLEDELDRHVFLSPVRGTVEEFAGLYPGSLVSMNRLIMTITPDTSLVAELYLPPAKAGLIKEGQEVRLLIDSYNYREWGTLSTRIGEITSDVLMINNKALFRAKCPVEQPCLYLSDGTAGRLKQGMSLRARLLLNKRSLIQILFDRVDKWLMTDPSGQMHS